MPVVPSSGPPFAPPAAGPPASARGALPEPSDTPDAPGFEFDRPPAAEPVEDLPRRQREFRYTPTVSAGPAGFADEGARISWLDEGRQRPSDTLFQGGFPGGLGGADAFDGTAPPEPPYFGDQPAPRDRVSFGGPPPMPDTFSAPVRQDVFGMPGGDPLQAEPGFEFGPGTGPMRALREPYGPERGNGREPATRTGSSLEFGEVRDFGASREFGAGMGPRAAGTGTAGTNSTSALRAPRALPPASSEDEQEENLDGLSTSQRLLKEIRTALRPRGWVVKVAVPILAMIPVGIAVVIIAGANNSNGTTTPSPDTTSLGFPPANFATADFTTSAAQAGRGLSQSLGAVVASGNEVVAIGTESGAQTNHTEFFVSQNGGRTWRLATEQGPGGANPAPGHRPTHIAVGPDGWVAVGPDSIWTSPNGTTWTLDSATGLPTQAGDQINVLTHTATGFLAAGENGTTPVIWLSVNGMTWQRVQPALAGARDIRYATATANAIVISGDLRTGGSGVWRSTDGTNWTAVTVPRTDAKNTIAGLAQLGNDFVAVRPGTRASRAEVYTSATGRTWTRSAQLATADGAALTLTFVKGGTTGAVVTGEADGFLIAFISANGTTWAGSDPFGTVRTETQTGVALTSGNVAVATGIGRVTNARRTAQLALVAANGAARRVALTGTVKHELAVTAVAASGATQVAVGSADGFPAIWTSTDGGTAWKRAVSAALTRNGVQQLAGVVHGNAGWVAVGGVVTNAVAHPVVVASANAVNWTAADNEQAFAGAGLSATAVTAGPEGYVIVGQQGRTPVAWFSAGLAGWQRVTLPGGAGSEVTGVVAASRGFVAVGTSGGRPVAWTSQSGRTWTLVTIPLPQGATRAELRYVAANGNRVVALGTEITTAGQSKPFATESANAGATWVDSPLPVSSGNAMVTALTAAGSGFTATGVFGTTPGTQDVVIWTLRTGTTWSQATPAGRGLQGTGIQEITALTAAGNELTGIGFIATAAAEQPTIWQSPVRG